MRKPSHGVGEAGLGRHLADHAGAASAPARRAGARGSAHVVITGRHQDPPGAAAAALGRDATGVAGDVGEIADVVCLADVFAAELGRVDVLVASAGVRTWNEPIGDVTEESFAAVFGVNVRGTFFAAQKLLALLSDGASIVLVGSGAADKGDPATTGYAASEAALRSFARASITDLRDRETRVNALSPAAIETPASADLPPGFTEKIAARVPIGRLRADP
ncbi:MAG TPA: SDR family oxidoreductase [Kribbella sp.]